ncbi:MAG: GH3 auxin-responsive promoter family protein [Prevotella sp.]|nr:GH3 auxin-responsive promoter family protein [Prevotella sp.]
MDEKTIKIVNEARWADGQKVWNRLEEITFDPMQCQEEFVMRLVRENANTEYGRIHGFDHIRGLDEYRSYVPLTAYENYQPYVNRIANGNKNVLTAYLTEHISTFDSYKSLPLSRWGVQACYDYSFSLEFYLAGNQGFLTDGMTLNLVDTHIEQLPSGVNVGNLVGRLLTRRDFDYDQVYVIPLDVNKSSQDTDMLYRQALYALRQEKISLALCDHYDNMIQLLRYIEKNWPSLAEDIELGNSYVTPDPERANAIRKVMESHHIGTQITEQLWSGLHCIMVFDVDRLSASFELLRTYCGNKVHFVFTGLGSPEGTFSTTLNIDDPQTVLIPDSVFYEFKPKESANYDYLLTLDQLEIGRSYEMVVSTLSGLYRYKTQKTILVVGRHHETPTVIVDKD